MTHWILYNDTNHNPSNKPYVRVSEHQICVFKSLKSLLDYNGISRKDLIKDFDLQAHIHEHYEKCEYHKNKPATVEYTQDGYELYEIGCCDNCEYIGTEYYYDGTPKIQGRRYRIKDSTQEIHKI